MVCKRKRQKKYSVKNGTIARGSRSAFLQTSASVRKISKACEVSILLVTDVVRLGRIEGQVTNRGNQAVNAKGDHS